MPDSQITPQCATDREIRSQPALWQLLATEKYNELRAIQEWVQQLDITEVWFTGAGTSAYIGDILATALSASHKVTFRSISSTDLVSAPDLYITQSVNPLIVSFGRSGNSSESVGVLNILDQWLPTAPRLNITCNPQSELAKRIHQHDRQRVLVLPAHDKGFAMTASFSCMVLSAAVVFDLKHKDTQQTLTRLSQRASALITTTDSWVASQSLPSRVVFLGSGSLKFAAREAALKVMELTAGKIPCVWDSPLGFRHGPKSFIDNATHVIVFESNNHHTRLYDQDLAEEIKFQFPHNPLTVVSGSHTASLSVDEELPDHWNSVLFLLVAQLLAVELSIQLQLNVDDPFAGSNTLTRVVAGVKLHPLHNL